MDPTEDIRNSELRHVLKHLDEDAGCHVANAVAEVTGADPAKVAAAVVRVRTAARIRTLVVATVVLVASLGTIALFRPLELGQEEVRTSSLVPARLP